ncbi:ImmA/IrrE family metallo-endopeptidase [Lysinibacillus fusiformis]|uniref:ImmA/IrrE family metallo-endopeptidase n=1 Tax=Lysinibacillus fusiformis TaxID=28031 RepID=UPI0011BB7103|nr:ImmA/IrrE family metallo-endopeptidase [Lysinibacillus fusiformis]QEA00848.1 ImmA/IrrE family metallo-endopeptidase [Lysinibacillus fusiformis]
MHLYDDLLMECDNLDIEVYEKDRMKNKGLYGDNVIWINKLLPSIIEKCCVLAEEIGHHHTTAGDIFDQSSIENRKQELRARAWAYERLIPFSKIVQAHNLHITNRYELADFLNVTEEFLDAALDWYKSKYGLYVSIDNFTVCFEPLGDIEMFDWIETPNLKYGS